MFSSYKPNSILKTRNSLSSNQNKFSSFIIRLIETDCSPRVAKQSMLYKKKRYIQHENFLSHTCVSKPLKKFHAVWKKITAAYNFILYSVNLPHFLWKFFSLISTPKPGLGNITMALLRLINVYIYGRYSLRVSWTAAKRESREKNFACLGEFCGGSRLSNYCN